MKKYLSLLLVSVFAGCVFAGYDFNAKDIVEGTLSNLPSGWEWEATPTELTESSVDSDLQEAFRSGSEGRVLKYVDETDTGYDLLILTVMSFDDNNAVRRFKESAISSIKLGGEIQSTSPTAGGWNCEERLDCEGFIKTTSANQKNILVCSNNNAVVFLTSQSTEGNFYDIEKMMGEVWDKIKAQ